MTDIKEWGDEGHGASADDIASAISRRIMASDFSAFVAQLRDVGKDIGDLTDAIEDVASWHEGAEELGSSDISIMVREVKRQLGLTESVTEAVTLDYSRYMRSHGKKPRDTHGGGMWMFTTKQYGMPEDDDTFEFSGSFADAKKAAAKWAKGKGEYRFYVMEEKIKEEKEALNKEVYERLYKVFDFSNFKGNEE